MAITLHDKFEKQIETVFTTDSLIKGRLSDKFSFAGVKTIKVMTPQTVPMVDYTRSGANRYGTPTEMQDIVQEMTLTQDKSFSMTIDKGNNADQNGLKSAGRMLKLQIKERAIPAMDKYCFEQLAHKAGTVAANSAKLTKDTVMDRIQLATQLMDDAEVPQEGRTLFVSNETFTLIKKAGIDLKTENTAENAFVKGQVGEIDGMKVVKVPAGRWVSNLNFLIVYKNAAIAPVKLNDTKLHQDPPGISGNLLEGRQYYDCFVLAAKCMGVYAEVNTNAGGVVLAAPTVSEAGDITAADGATAVYTTDGSDPRYSMTAKTGLSIAANSGDVMKVYQYKDGAFPSAVVTVTHA
ncbi:MAG: hypothetical protein IKV41_05685 [Oscillospiraceae bacterium]|nr:hypothetical protein [Oscillospiraceae bacterium]